MKLNVDASFHEENRSGATGAIIRDTKGEFVAASSSFLANVDSVVMAKAIAMREGLELAIRLGCNKVMSESDSTEVIEAMNGSEGWWNASAAVFADCIDKVATIGVVSFRHIGRDANQVAHELARASYDSKQSCNWVDEPPSFILDRLLHDVTIL